MDMSGIGNINTVVLCIGTMRVTGDSVGPRVGDILKARGVNCFVYGDSVSNINARKLDVYQNLIEVCHKADIVIAVDAALGEKADVGRVKITKCGLYPGRALGRKSKSLGDIGVLAVVGEKGEDNYNFFIPLYCIIYGTRLKSFAFVAVFTTTLFDNAEVLG